MQQLRELRGLRQLYDSLNRSGRVQLEHRHFGPHVEANVQQMTDASIDVEASVST